MKPLPDDVEELDELPVPPAPPAPRAGGARSSARPLTARGPGAAGRGADRSVLGDDRAADRRLQHDPVDRGLRRRHGVLRGVDLQLSRVDRGRVVAVLRAGQAVLGRGEVVFRRGELLVGGGCVDPRELLALGHRLSELHVDRGHRAARGEVRGHHVGTRDRPGRRRRLGHRLRLGPENGCRSSRCSRCSSRRCRRPMRTQTRRRPGSAPEHEVDQQHRPPDLRAESLETRLGSDVVGSRCSCAVGRIRLGC